MQTQGAVCHMKGTGWCRDAEYELALVTGDKSYEDKGSTDSWWKANEQWEQEACERKGYKKEASQMSNSWPSPKIPRISSAAVPPVTLHCQGTEWATRLGETYCLLAKCCTHSRSGRDFHPYFLMTSCSFLNNSHLEQPWFPDIVPAGTCMRPGRALHTLLPCTRCRCSTLEHTCCQAIQAISEVCFLELNSH